MPQIWMTYHEIADMLGCEPEMARVTSIQRALDRKKSRDGLTRVKLDSELTARFITELRSADAALDQAVRALLETHQAMARADRTGFARPSIERDAGIAAAG
ncbi:hypothetical protein [Bradyrhizobium tropiciagri]|uniref:hypothetical protein n=1 Tax=Bradyrhizobium tropiciagri TaxID=312253 RepID=UPI002013051C|nr:hypothetical protein [Bradyrhizobium tropiciagri]